MFVFQMCRTVQKEQCRQVPRQVCRSVPKQDCKKVPRKVQREDCKQVRVSPCLESWHGGTGAGDTVPERPERAVQHRGQAGVQGLSKVIRSTPKLQPDLNNSPRQTSQQNQENQLLEKCSEEDETVILQGAVHNKSGAEVP